MATRYEIGIEGLRRMYVLVTLLDRTKATKPFATILASLIAGVEIVKEDSRSA